MRFRNIYLPENITKAKGIEPINLERLGNVIAFVGKNGSGKSRILNLLEQNIFNYINVFNLLNKGDIDFLPNSLVSLKSELSPYKEYFSVQEELKHLNLEINKNSGDSSLRMRQGYLQTRLQSYGINNAAINNLIAKTQSEVALTKQKYFRKISSEEIKKLQNTAVQGVTLFEQIMNNGFNGAYNEISALNNSALGFLSVLPHQLAFNNYESIAQNKPFEEMASYKKFMSLKKFFAAFLKKDLGWEKITAPGNLSATGSDVRFTGKWLINDRPFNYAEFSEGEKTLFAYALLFFLLDQNPNLNIRESIIMIDEPELHLHPDSEIDVINGIKNAIGEKGQLIIATHSINILSTLSYEEIFMVKNGQIKHPSQQTPGESLNELMSIEDRVNKLSDFLSSISTWSYVNFMAQCFSNPDVIESARQDDPQVLAFKKSVRENINKQTNMLLDFGAGKGRLFEQIKSDYDFIDKVNYSALEPNTEFHDTLTNLGAEKVFTSYEELIENSFDFILLCNVLHEIPIADWQQNLNKIIKSLKPDGFLVIIEAKVLNKGEKIGKIGYLLLGIEEIQKLFQLPSLAGEIKPNDSAESITCVVLKKDQLKEVSKKEILDCLNALEENTFKKIEALREKTYDSKESYGIGRKSGFLSQLNLNARFAIKHIQDN